MITVNYYNEVFFKISTEQKYEKILIDFSTVLDPNRMYNPLYKMGQWDGKICLYKNKLFPIGLWNEVKKYCKEKDIKIDYDFDTKMIKNKINEEDFKNEVIDYAKFPPREYQWQSAYTVLKAKRGLLQLPTGSGKSLTIHMMIKYIYKHHLKEGKKIVLLMNNIGLVEQMYSDFQEYKKEDDEFYNDISVIYGTAEKDRKNLDKNILFTTYQSFITLTSLFGKVQAIMVDEVQIAKSLSVRTINSALTAAEFRIGLSATIPKEEFDAIQIKAYLGPIVYKLKAKYLMDIGLLANIKVNNLIIDYLTPTECTDYAYMDYNNILDKLSYDERRVKILDYIFDDMDENENTIMLFKRVDKSLKPVFDYLEKRYPNKKIYKITGEVKGKKREEIRKSIQDEKGCILLGTEKIVSFGLNIPNINNVVLFNPLKSDITLMQAIGRSLRPSKGKEFARLFDVVDYYVGDKSNPKLGISLDHLKSKISCYTEEEYEFNNIFLKFKNNRFTLIEDLEKYQKVIKKLTK